jgi:Ca2+-binding EF-hand superfamily protein
MYPLDSDLDNVFRRMDSDADGLINFSEFSSFLQGFSKTTTRAASPYKNSSPIRKTATYGSPIRKSTLLMSSFYERPSSPIRTLIPRAASPIRTGYRASLEYRPMTTSYHSPIRRSSPIRQASPVRRRDIVVDRYASPVRSTRTLYRSRSPMKGLEENKLAETFKETISNEKSLESEKNSLALKADFSLSDAFRVFDRYDYGSVSAADFREGCTLYGSYPTAEEVQLLINRHDKNGDGRLNYSEFCELFVSREYTYSSLLKGRSSYYQGRYVARHSMFSHST